MRIRRTHQHTWAAATWMTSTLHELHDLAPCGTCDIRMAVPGAGLCTVCDVELPSRVPDLDRRGQLHEEPFGRTWQRDGTWDFWFADTGDAYHVFFLRASRALQDPHRRHRRARAR